MPTTTSNAGSSLHWDEAGSGTPLLLVMGAAYSSAMWYPAIPALSARHRVIWFDNRGTGQSAATRVASIADMAQDALAVLDAAGVERAHLYGVSLGGVVAQELARLAPERVTSLVLGCTGILDEHKPRAPKGTNIMFKVPRSWLVKAMARRGSYGPACPEDRRLKDVQVLLAERPDRVALRAQQDALRAYSISLETVAAFDIPALVLHGDADSTVRYAWGQELAATLPGARLVTFEGVGHNFLVGAGDQANDEVLAFLGEVDQPAVL
ncbi:MAG: alpha/beta hydrolase fold protein [Frankiales bacterium]|nr:alpha/beta hydrolase fold protein [Frankiales bacterium]